MKKKTIKIGPPQFKFNGVTTDGKYMFEIRFNISDTDTTQKHQRGIGIYIDPEDIWMISKDAQVPYVDAKLYEIVEAGSYEEQFEDYYNEVEIIRLEKEEDEEENKDGMVKGYDGKMRWL